MSGKKKKKKKEKIDELLFSMPLNLCVGAKCNLLKESRVRKVRSWRFGISRVPG